MISSTSSASIPPIRSTRGAREASGIPVEASTLTPRMFSTAPATASGRPTAAVSPTDSKPRPGTLTTVFEGIARRTGSSPPPLASTLTKAGPRGFSSHTVHTTTRWSGPLAAGGAGRGAGPPRSTVIVHRLAAATASTRPATPTARSARRGAGRSRREPRRRNLAGARTSAGAGTLTGAAAGPRVGAYVDAEASFHSEDPGSGSLPVSAVHRSDKGCEATSGGASEGASGAA
jgi:hypothetical protein